MTAANGTTLTVNGHTFTVGTNFEGIGERNRRNLARALSGTNLDVVGGSGWTRVQVHVDPFAEFA